MRWKAAATSKAAPNRLARCKATDESRFGQGKLANFDLGVGAGDQGALPYVRDGVRA
jgi:hypothetical protein